MQPTTDILLFESRTQQTKRTTQTKHAL